MVWQIINFVAFRSLPNLPIYVGGALVIAGHHHVLEAYVESLAGLTGVAYSSAGVVGVLLRCPGDAPRRHRATPDSCQLPHPFTIPFVVLSGRGGEHRRMTEDELAVQAEGYREMANRVRTLSSLAKSRRSSVSSVGLRRSTRGWLRASKG